VGSIQKRRDYIPQKPCAKEHEQIGAESRARSHSWKDSLPGRTQRKKRYLIPTQTKMFA
jgi:hypothetical protein